ncbi:hypothetical protein OJF2_41820 [Aquisphaera giovannonii]|uniref:Uncharacterized protein n=2 Tax=Aquisphaera giovannonii TaxID=406548 RepID=A0A5B9W645_9BACT|nr:hypothetical protein OJF2_41820 [Aquisphaera giovannonii]
MGKLADHLLENVPNRITSEVQPEWSPIASDLKNNIDLESALSRNRPSDALEAVIVELTSKLILEAERQVIEQVVNGNKTLRLTRLIPHLLKPENGIPIVTTNYDRLVEVAVEQSGLSLNTLFVGQHFGRLDPESSHLLLCKRIDKTKTGVKLNISKHAVVLKPHGSLDWYQHHSGPVRCPFPLGLQRLIITPGLNKYRDGYNKPFDSHRERANREIDKASRYLILGFGFNDAHLQTHLESELERGKPALVLTHSLTPHAEKLAKGSGRLTALCAAPDHLGTKVISKNGVESIPGASIWDLGHFIQDVLEP